MAYELAKTFDHVFAADISQSQINNALQVNNVIYSVQPAENTSFDNGFFDLILVAPAIHWFDFDQFYKEVGRAAKDNALLCVVGYGRIKITAAIDDVITNFYTNIIGTYWDKERKYIDENYEIIPFSFEEIQTPKFVNLQYWALAHLIGFLNTWSSVKHFIKQNGFNPIDQLQLEIEPLWGKEQIRQIHFPILLRIGRIAK